MSEKMYRVQSCAHCPYMRWRCCHPSHDQHKREPSFLGGIPDWCPLEDVQAQPDERITALSRVAAELEALCEDASIVIALATAKTDHTWRETARKWMDRWFHWTEQDAPEEEPAA